MFPKVEIKRFGGSYALIFTESGALQIYKIRADHERAFNTDLGRFQTKKENRYVMGRGDVQIYDQKSCNPIDIMALVDIRQFIADRKLETLPPKLTAILSGGKAFSEYLPTKPDPENKGYPVLDNEQIQNIINNVVKDKDEVIVSEPSTETEPKVKLEQATVRFLSNYYNEDVQVHLATLGKMLSSMKWRAKGSMKAFGIFSTDLYRKDHVALVIINNKSLDAVPAKLDLDIQTGKYWIVTKKYGKFEYKDAKTRYRYGKSNIFLVSVKTTPPKHVEKTRKPLFAMARNNQNRSKEIAQ